MSSSRGGRIERLLQRGAAHICWIVPLIALLAGLRRIRGGWDDGAITQAFARTLAQTGKIALTPVSEQVEGFSSIGWVLILAAGSKIVHSVGGMLAWAKLISSVCFSGSLFLFRRIAARFVDGLWLPFAVILLACTVTPFTEVINGMEMNLYMLLILALAGVLLTRERPSPSALLFAALLSFGVLSTRFESPILLLAVYLGAVLEFRQTKTIALLLIADAAYFAAAESWRQMTFHTWVPNTILAKRWVPYRLPGMKQMVLSRVLAVGEILIVLLIPIVALFLLWMANKVWPELRRHGSSGMQVSTALVVIPLAALLLDLVLGKNWGHPGRMVLASTPFFILLLVFGFRAMLHQGQMFTEAVISVVVLCHIATWTVLALSVFRENAASVAQVEQVGFAADDIRQLLHQKTLSLFIPDIGGAALCCENLVILDSGLLSNRYLARTGFAGTATYLAANRPDVIETHGTWAQLTGLYSSGYLDGYGLVSARDNFLFVRRDLYQQMLADGLQEMPADDGLHLCGVKALPDDQADLLYLTSISRCIHLGK